MTHNASGRFEVKLGAPIPEDVGEARAVTRRTIEKRFYGDLEGSGMGEMLAVETDVDGSAGYVAMERISGVLDGHQGTFALQHSGTMERGISFLTVSVVPDSGTDQLVGLEGRMTISIFNGQHLYEFEYTLPG